jgi:hypothetical protein
MLVMMRGKRNHHTLLVWMWASTTTWKTIWRLLIKVNRSATWPSNTIPTECSSGYYKGTYLHTHVYCNTIHNSQAMETAKMPHYWWMYQKMWYLYTMEFYSATKKTEILSFASKWMKLEDIILSKDKQTQKAKNHMFSLICRL